MSLIEQIKEVMADHVDNGHVDDMARIIAAYFSNLTTSVDIHADKESALLSSDKRRASTITDIGNTAYILIMLEKVRKMLIHSSLQSLH